MSIAPASVKRLLGFLSALAGAVLVAAIGWACVEFSFGAGLLRFSYDLPFTLHNRPANDVCLVYMDENASRALGQNAGIWDRRIHAQLLKRLTAEGAKAVFFDLVFIQPSADPTVDQEFAAAIQENGHVFLNAAIEVDAGLGGDSERVVPPISALRRVAAGWGLATFRPVDSDWGVRFLYPGTETVPTAAWRMAAKLGAPLPALDDLVARNQPRWLNYYGPVGWFPQIGYDRALQPEGVPAGFFKDKIVFVGGRSALGTLGLGKDDFHQPHTRWDQRFAPGLEIHVTEFLNLFHQEWLTRIAPFHENGLIIGAGLLLGCLLPRFRPSVAVLITLAFLIAIMGVTLWMAWEKRIWFNWSIIILVQAPLALVWAISMRYLIEERKRKQLRTAFSCYLSPEMADQISDTGFDLRPGGKVVETSIMFTDLEGFTSLSEKLADPERLAKVLSDYFTQTTGHILENKGTIIKYIGDAVLAVWGAPLPDEDHPRRAALAAWRLHEASHLEVEGLVVRTRVGLHTGRVLAGNLGSAQRFDYTVIGDPVNFSSRLEGLNKYFGTNILISEATRERLNGEFLTRSVGKITVSGKKEPVIIHELLGPMPTEAPPAWIATFDRAVAAYQAGDLVSCRAVLEEVCAMRGGQDGPSKLYLEKLDYLEKGPLPDPWTGVIEMTSK